MDLSWRELGGRLDDLLAMRATRGQPGTPALQIDKNIIKYNRGRSAVNFLSRLHDV